MSEILGTNEVASDVFDGRSSTKWMNYILYAIVGQDMSTVFDATIDSLINICENCWSIMRRILISSSSYNVPCDKIEQVWVMFYPGSSTRIATLRGGFEYGLKWFVFKSLSVFMWWCMNDTNNFVRVYMFLTSLILRLIQ